MSLLEQSMNLFPKVHKTRPPAVSEGTAEVMADKQVLKKLQTSHGLQGLTCMLMGICYCKRQSSWSREQSQ